MTRAMPLAELLPDVDGVPPDVVVTGLVQDSRAVRAGDAFVAIAGFGTHGLAFADTAIAQGAAAVLHEPPAPRGMHVPDNAIAVPGLRARLGTLGDQFHGRPSAQMDVVGVTGTNGKTSTVQLLAQAWHHRGVRGASVGTLGSLGLRAGPVTANARSLPATMFEYATAVMGAPKATCWPSTALTISEAPLYGTCVACAWLTLSTISTPRCEGVPTPPDA